VRRQQAQNTVKLTLRLLTGTRYTSHLASSPHELLHDEKACRRGDFALPERDVLFRRDYA
jgi:hypothetical protein